MANQLKKTAKSVLALACCCLLSAALLSGCGFTQPVVKSMGQLNDNDGAYALPRDSWETLWLEIRPTNQQSFAHTIGNTKTVAGEKPRFPSYLHVGDEQKAAEEFMPAEVQIKGNNTYRHFYRSLKVSLLGEDLWLGRRIFTLYKNVQDPSKIAMIFGLDAFALFEDIISVSAGFVDLKLRDLSSGWSNYEEYGLYTQTENLGGRYLRAHGLDRHGLLYEAKDFGFEYEKWLELDEAGRQAALEQNNGEGYQKLEQMLADLAQSDDFESMFERYFDRENYLTWLAGSILLGNVRAGRDTYQLYSPSDSEKWYFFPAPSWALLQTTAEHRRSDPPESYFGLGMFYDNFLHANFLQSYENREALRAKVEQLRLLLNDEVINGLCEKYQLVLAHFLGREPDQMMTAYTPLALEARLLGIPGQINGYQELFQQNIHRPAPFSINLPEQDRGAWLFSWQDKSRENEELSYEFRLSYDPEGKELIYQGSADEPSVCLMLELEGVVYLQVKALTKEGYSQLANNSTPDSKGNTLWGLIKLSFAQGEVNYG